MRNLEHVLQGKLQITSGFLLILDPSLIPLLHINSLSIIKPPYLVQEDDFLLIPNPEGCGRYPILQNSERIIIYYNYPIKKFPDGTLDQDREKLMKRSKGKIIGYANSNSGMHMLIDGEKIKNSGKNKSKLLFKMEVPKDSYRCKFIYHCDALSIGFA